MSGYLRRLGDVIRRGNRFRIFISYRRQGEGAGYAGRLADKLLQEFGEDQCFRDIDDIEAGVDFVQSINEAVGTCEVLITVIGRDWVSMTDGRGNLRLEDPNDFVRLEIAAALSRNVRVIPVLVGGAEMPSAEQLPDALEPLSRRQAHEITDTRWDFDVGRLLDSIEAAGVRRLAQKRSVSLRRVGSFAAAVAGLIVLSTAVWQLAAAMSQPTPVDFGTIPALTLPNELEPDRRPVDDVKGGVEAEVTKRPTAKSTAQSDDARREAAALELLEAEARGKREAEARAAREADAREADARAERAAEDRAAVENVLFGALPAQSEALRSLDPTSLSFFFDGDALSENLRLVEGLATAGTHMDLHLNGYDVLSVEVDGDHAMAEVRETWTAQIHQNGSDYCLGVIPYHTAQGERYLARANGSWKVTGMSQAQTTPDVVVGC